MRTKCSLQKKRALEAAYALMFSTSSVNRFSEKSFMNILQGLSSDCPSMFETDPSNFKREIIPFRVFPPFSAI